MPLHDSISRKNVRNNVTSVTAAWGTKVGVGVGTVVANVPDLISWIVLSRVEVPAQGFLSHYRRPGEDVSKRVG